MSDTRTKAQPTPSLEAQRQALLGLLPSKASPPSPGPWAVMRASLVDKLIASHQHRVVALVAPAGYGKSTLLAQWAEREERRVAWLALDHRDNDPVVLFSYLLASAKGGLDVDGEESERQLPALAYARDGLAPRAALALREIGKCLLVLDNFEAIEDQACLDAVAEFVRLAPGDVQLALASRADPGIPLARLTVAGDLLELGATDLAMDADEVSSIMFAITGRQPDPEQVQRLQRRTEGWAAGVVLMALASMHAAGQADDGQYESIDLRRYFRDEVLAGRSSDELRFLTRSSILDQMTPSLCDAVLGESGSGQRLEALAATNSFISRRGEDDGKWFRYHSLFRDALRDRLEDSDPDEIPSLHARAAKWYAEHGYGVAAVDHAFDAGQLPMAAELVGRQWPLLQWAGRTSVVNDWLGRFPDAAISSRPYLGVIGAWLAALAGNDAAALRFADIVDEASYDGPMPDGAADFDSARAILGAAMVRPGLSEAERSVALAAHHEPVRSAWRPIAQTQLALCQLASGDLAGARASAQSGVDGARPLAAVGPLMGSLSILAELAMRDGDRAAAEDFATECWAEAQRAGVQDYPTTVLCRSLLAMLAAQRGNRVQARADLADLQRLRPRLTGALPIANTLHLLAMARALSAGNDDAGAWTVMRDVDAILANRSDLDALSTYVDGWRAQLERAHPQGSGPFTLTTAELRVLQYLPTHLTFPEIAQRLFVSHSTVKAQARAIYGKLDASTRTEAVGHALDAGLLDPSIRALAALSIGAADDGDIS